MAPKLTGARWRAKRRIGRGATSEVWLAEAEDGTRAALKIASDPAHASRLADEAERLLLVRGDALPRLLDAGVVGAAEPELAHLAGHAYVAMDYAPGKELDVRAVRDRVRLALVVARDVGEGLAELHAAGSAHGDVKPANIVVDRGPRARLVDLGLGTDADEQVPRGGTRRYLGPEVFAGDGGDARARDLWALGVTLAELASEDIARADDPARADALSSLAPEVAPIVRALLAPSPAARPSAAWVRRRAMSELGELEPIDRRQRRARHAVQRAYLVVRARELAAAARHRAQSVEVTGVCGQWLSEAVRLARSVAALRGEPLSGELPPLEELGPLGRSRWLVALVGAAAARWPLPPGLGDSELAERLLSLADSLEPESFTLAALLGGVADPVEVPRSPRRWPWRSAAERRPRQFSMPPSGSCPAAVRPRLGTCTGAGAAPARRRRPRARRAGAAGHAHGTRRERRGGCGAPAKSSAHALALDEIDTDGPGRPRARGGRSRTPRAGRGGPRRRTSAARRRRAHGSGAGVARPGGAPRGRSRCRHGKRDLGLTLARGDEEHARLEAALGYVAHFAGDAEAAHAAFSRAAEHAERCGAVLEEATYLTSVAAAAANLGELGSALRASSRAILLFEHLGRQHDAARAALSRASVYASAGVAVEARDAAADAMVRARAAGDDVCRAYAHLAVCDALGPGEHEGREHAERARGLLSDPSADDELFVGARLLRHGADVDVDRLDTLARDGARALDARLDWWGARAWVEARASAPSRPQEILLELAQLTSVRAPLTVRGPAAAAGGALAARVGDGDSVRRFALLVRELGRELAERAPPELRAAVAQLPWVRTVESPVGGELAPEQLGDVEALVHALGTRDRLRPLLDQVLDALVLWTGVERGLLLLRAPGGRLVPRAARNLARRDLTGEQLALSQSLAERAAQRREPVVAVDAAGEMSDVHASVHALKLRSVLAVPLMARGEVLGVAYLDDRVRRGAFGPRELAWVRLVAALASVAIADARDQLLLRRAARRARRAEARLARELAQREAALDVAERELALTRSGRGTRFDYPDIIGESEPLTALLRLVDRVALSDVPVLVTGESGSGKELVARAIHRNGPRARLPFVSENCGAIPEGLLESALFGHVKGAFTGASRPRAGLFEVADGGTLFLDEIGEMSLGMQTKLLRVLEDGEVRAVGGERSRTVNVRVIGATNRDLEELVLQGRFRQDLLYRLNVIALRVPPLRERPGDIPLLVAHLIAKHAEQPVDVTKPAMAALVGASWPGNVRQLENELRRALVLADGEIRLEHLSPEIRESEGKGPRATGLNLKARVDALEAELLETALERTGGNQTRAAELLGLSRYGLSKMMKRLDVDAVPESGRRSAGAVGKRR